ncbi:MAG: hypothetical protein M3282_02630 [Gemmatimonadota bacterium]|nr:hypothetical protein [Gemmatimonadota bacterium]
MEPVCLEALRISTRPALVTALGRAALAVLVGVALVLSVWKGLPLTASVIATGGLLMCAVRGRARSTRGHGFHDAPPVYPRV